MNSNRFFQVSPTDYKSIRISLDAQWNHPNGKAETCMPPAALAVTNGARNVIVHVLREVCDWPEVAPVLADLLANGHAVEVDAATYLSHVPSSPDP
jgi:hypothetical protein